MPTSNVIHLPAAAKATDEFDSDLNQVSSAVPRSSPSEGSDEYDPKMNHISSAVHEPGQVFPGKNDDAALPFVTEAEVATTTKNGQDDQHSKPSVAGVESPSRNTLAYGALGFNQTFAYPACASAFPDANQSFQQLKPGHIFPGVFPGQSPPFQAENGGYFSGIDSLQIKMPSNPTDPSKSAAAAAGTPQPQPITITHLSPGHTYATVPYPYHISFPTGQPLVQHPNGKFFPAIMSIVPSGQGDNRDAASLLSRIVDDPPYPPESALGQPKKWIRWTDTEDVALKTAVKKYGEDKMELISRSIFLNTRSLDQCRQRWKKALQPGLVKGKWTKEEDALILEMVKTSTVQGADGELHTPWSTIAQRLPGRLGEHVKARWINHLDPDIRRGVWTKTEMDLLTEAQKELGNRWSEIAKRIPGRSENSVKNRWYNAKTSLKRKTEKETEEAEKRRHIEEILSRQADNTDENDDTDRRSSTESNETIQSLIFKSDESEDHHI